MSSLAKGIAMDVGATAAVTGAVGGDVLDPEALVGAVVGAVGSEAIEFGLKKALARKTMKTVVSSAGTKVGATVAANIAKQTVKRAVVGTAAKTGASFAAKAAVKTSLGPVGWAMLAVDVVSLGLDLWDPFDLNTLHKNSDLNKMHADYVKQIQTAYGNQMVENSMGLQVKGRDLSPSDGGPIKFPMKINPKFPLMDESGAFRDEGLNRRFVELQLEYLRDNGFKMDEDPFPEDVAIGIERSDPNGMPGGVFQPPGFTSSLMEGLSTEAKVAIILGSCSAFLLITIILFSSN